jgi:carboxymethylenebutenolidase
MSRRDFSKAAISTALALSLPETLAAEALVSSNVIIKTPDGTCDAVFVHPTVGTYPAVLIWPDILSLRPAFQEMAAQLARSGYSVLCVNPYYRDRTAPVVELGETFGDPSTREKVMPMYRKLNARTHKTDAISFTRWLDAQPAVNSNRKIGTMGYCMGGPIALRTAAAMPNRIGAACSYHGGGLVTEASDSPHLLIPTMQAEFLIAIAENDDERDPNSKVVLAREFEKHELSAEIEVYEGTMHGWCVLDSPVYSHAPAERAWSRTLALFDEAL